MKEFKANILNGGVKFGMGENAGKVSGLLIADDTTLMAESENSLQRYVSAFVRMCERRKLKINVGKSKVMKMSDTGEKSNLSIKVKEEVMDEVDTYYIGWKVFSNTKSYSHNSVYPTIILTIMIGHCYVCIDLK